MMHGDCADIETADGIGSELLIRLIKNYLLGDINIVVCLSIACSSSLVEEPIMLAKHCQSMFMIQKHQNGASLTQFSALGKNFKYL